MQLSENTRRPFTSIKTPTAVKRSTTPSIATKPLFSKRLIHHLLDGEFEGQDFLTSRSPRGVGWNHDRATPLSNKRRTMPQLSRTTLELRLKAPC